MSRIDQNLQDILNWAQRRLQSGEEPPWARDNYSRLVDVLNDIIAGREATITLEDLRRLEEHQERVQQQSDRNDHANIVQLRPHTVRVQMPM